MDVMTGSEIVADPLLDTDAANATGATAGARTGEGRRATTRRSYRPPSPRVVRGSGVPPAGLFWLRRNRFVGSYRPLIAASRSQVGAR